MEVEKKDDTLCASNKVIEVGEGEPVVAVDNLSTDLVNYKAADMENGQLECLNNAETLDVKEPKRSRFSFRCSKPENNAHLLKYVSLITLTLQNAILGLSMRYARTREGDKFFITTVVLMAEVVKLVTCLFIVFIETGGVRSLIITLHKTVVKDYMDTLKVCVPSLIYVIQNNLLYVSASHLDAATYQVTYQLKILTTALFAVLILKKKLLPTQWISLVTLIIGIVLVQLAQKGDSTTKESSQEQSPLTGFLAALSACVLSGFAGIYFEKILKGSDISVWMRNIQLSLLSIPFALASCFIKDAASIREKGFFFGYDNFVVYLICLNACGGLIVAMVVKYADNILKGFATSLAIVISCIASIYIFGFVLTLQFAGGALFVIFSIFLYSYVPKKRESGGNIRSA